MPRESFVSTFLLLYILFTHLALLIIGQCLMYFITDATTDDRLSVVVPDESKEQTSMMVSPASTSITDSTEQGM